MFLGQLYKFLLRKFRTLMALPTVLLICIPQDRSLLSSTPRYGWCLTSASLVFIIVYSCMTRFLFLETLSVEHLEALNLIWHLSAHAISWSRSDCRLVVSQMFSMVQYNKQSSANSRMWVDGCRLSPMSLIYSRNNNGPWTVPWGTPDFSGTGLDVVPSTTTVSVLLVSQLSIQVRAWPLTP